jgi:hypothetical protein
MEIRMPRDEELVALYRYFVWANNMRVHFEDTLKRTGVVDLDTPDGFYVAMYMSLWYGCLYVVIEGWQELQLRDQEIDSFLTSPNVDLLRRFRNATFHYHREYLHEKFLAFLREGEATATWVRGMHNAFASYFAHEFEE